MAHKTSHHIIVLGLAVICLVGCGPTPIYEQSYPVNAEGWSYNDSVAFAFDVKDIEQPYDLLLDVDHTTGFSYSNLYINIATIFADGKRKEQMLSLDLTDETSSWLGDCSEESCSVTIPIVESRKFRSAGNYQLIIYQHSRKELLRGIQGISLRIMPIK